MKGTSLAKSEIESRVSGEQPVSIDCTQLAARSFLLFSERNTMQTRFVVVSENKRFETESFKAAHTRFMTWIRKGGAARCYEMGKLILIERGSAQ